LCDFEAGRIPLHRLCWLVPIFALWANVHAGGVGGLATMAAAVTGWGIAAWLGRPSPLTGLRQLGALVVLVIACGLACLLNPCGIGLPRVWFALIGSPVLPRLMQEHAPLRHAGPEALTVLLFGLVYLVALAGAWRSGPRVTWLIPLLWLYLAWTSI